ncbi:MAG: hypothetical protein ACKVP3_24130 [Hyphomicrobiaceae bacterium]
MIGQPENPLRPAFEKAREWAREQERLLNDRQRQVFEAMKHRQATEREIRQKWLDGARDALREREKSKKPKAELVLNPPVRVADPETRRLARLAIANEKRLERLDQRHESESIKMLKQFEQERAKEAGKSLSSSWLKAVSKATTHEADRAQEKEREKAKDFDRSR